VISIEGKAMRLLIISLFIILLLGCSSGNDDEIHLSKLYSSDIELIQADKLTFSELDLVNEELNVNEKLLKLDTFLWRDFMPGNSSDSSLKMSLKLVEQYYTNLSDFNLEAVYIINGDEVWYSEQLEKQEYQDTSSESRYRLDGGPEWDTGTFVDVVAVIKFQQQKFYLKATKQFIDETH
jgi:hypothetical protein